VPVDDHAVVEAGSSSGRRHRRVAGAVERAVLDAIRTKPPIELQISGQGSYHPRAETEESMRLTIMAVVGTALLAGMAWAQDGGGMDMSKMGPGSRRPTNEAGTKKEIAGFFKETDELEKKGDFDGMLARVDFPVFMLTDDSKGVPRAEAWSQEQYVAMMKPMMEHMPKDVKVTHKPTVTVLSDSLVNVTDDFTMTMGKQKMSGRNMGVLVKRDGKWRWKMMGEAGWGDMPSPPTAAPEKK
jgi:hypothetical protein